MKKLDLPVPGGESQTPLASARQAASPGPQPKTDVGGNNIRVAVRIRPFNARELGESEKGSADAFDVVGKSVVIKGSADAMSSSEYTRAGRTFNFDEVFSSTDSESKGDATQQTIFEGIGVPILENALDAYNGCLLAYGQTGSGKSHSVLGDASSESEKGILPRACERLFQMVEKRKADSERAGEPMQTAILASYLEIYQEKMYDLLVSDRSDLQVRLHKDLGPHVPGLTQTPVASMQDVQDLLDFGAKHRAVGATCMNATSSRSHAVFTVDLRITSSIDGGTRDMQSKVNFVDLAGSEKQKKTGATGERLQEGIAINQSLSALSRVIQALSGSAGKGAQPPFRESKLTLLLKDALSGNSRTVLLACISPSRFNLEESVSTLEFASRCKMIKTNAKKNEQDKQELIESLTAEKERIAIQLQEEASMRERLQAELEKEMEVSRANQERALKIQMEKEDIERQLRELEAQAHSSKQEEARAKATEEQLKRKQEELRLQTEDMKVEHEAKAQEMQRQLQDKEELARHDQRLKEAELLRLQEEKECQLAEAEEGRKKALAALEESARRQEEEQRAWARKNEETVRRALELEDKLDRQAQVAQADSEERQRLERIRQDLEKERRDRREQYLREVESLSEEKTWAEAQLRELLSERREVETRQAEELAREEERQAQERERLRMEGEELDEKHRLLREKAAQATAEAEKRERAMAELKEKERQLATRLREEEERRREEQWIQAEVTKRVQKEAGLKTEMTGLDHMCSNLRLEEPDLERFAHAQKQQRQQLLEERGIQGLDDDGEDTSALPRLTNLHPDPSLEGVLTYFLKPGRTQVGADRQKCRIFLTGLDVADEVCVIENEGNERLVLMPLPNSFVRVNGVQVLPTDVGQELSNGDHLAIGRAQIFRVVIPNRKKMEDDDHEKHFVTAMQELQDNAEIDAKWRRAVDDAVGIVKQNYGTKQANDLLRAAKAASETIAQANSRLRSVPPIWADHVSHYELAVLFEADGPPVVCVVARASAGGAGVRSKGVWEAERFMEERLQYMMDAEEAVTALREESRNDPGDFLGQGFGDVVKRAAAAASAGKLRDPNVDDLPSYAWSEVPLARYEELIADKDRIIIDLEEELRHLQDKDKVPEAQSVWQRIFGSAKAQAGSPRPVEEGTQARGQEDSTFLNMVANVLSWGKAMEDKPSKPEGPRARSASRPGRAAKKKQDCPGRQGSVPAQAPRTRTPMAADEGSSPSRSPEGLARVNIQRHDNAPQIQNGVSTWPASQREDGLMVGRIKVAKARTDTSSGPTEPVDVKVTQLFEGKLGVRLRMENLLVTGFDNPKAQELGWCVGDAIVKIQGNPVSTKEEFRSRLEAVKRELPIVFTVYRAVGKSSGKLNDKGGGVRRSITLPAGEPLQNMTSMDSRVPSRETE